jgi:hypothetical protein
VAWRREEVREGGREGSWERRCWKGWVWGRRVLGWEVVRVCRAVMRRERGEDEDEEEEEEEEEEDLPDRCCCCCCCCCC